MKIILYTVSYSFYENELFLVWNCFYTWLVRILLKQNISFWRNFDSANGKVSKHTQETII